MIYRSTIPDVEIPDVTLFDHVLGRAREHGDKVAVVDATSGEQITYRELADAVDAAAAGLAATGVRPGDVVAVMSHNQPRFPIALYAALRAGAAVTPVNPMLTTGELVKQLTGANASVLVSSAQSASKAAEAALAAGIEHHFVLDGQQDGGAPAFDDLLGTGAAPPQVDLDPRTALAALPFSSGTTGLSKGSCSRTATSSPTWSRTVPGGGSPRRMCCPRRCPSSTSTGSRSS